LSTQYKEGFRVELFDNYVITTDSRQYILAQPVVRANGKHAGVEVMSDPRYFSSLKHVLKHFIETELRKSNVKTLKEVIERIEQLEKKVDEIIKY